MRLVPLTNVCRSMEVIFIFCSLDHSFVHTAGPACFLFSVGRDGKLSRFHGSQELVCRPLRRQVQVVCIVYPAPAPSASRWHLPFHQNCAFGQVFFANCLFDSGVEQLAIRSQANACDTCVGKVSAHCDLATVNHFLGFLAESSRLSDR